MNDLIKYLLSEADFNRSWTDGRRGDFVPTEDYISRRIQCAELFEQWAKAVGNFENKITAMKLVLCDCEGLLEAATKTELDQDGMVTEQLEFVRKASKL